MASLQNYWEEGHTQEEPRPQPYSGQIELLTDLLETYLMARKNATPERLQHSQQRWKELSTEVAVISQLKKQTRQSQLIRALVSDVILLTLLLSYILSLFRDAEIKPPYETVCREQCVK